MGRTVKSSSMSSSISLPVRVRTLQLGREQKSVVVAYEVLGRHGEAYLICILPVRLMVLRGILRGEVFPDLTFCEDECLFRRVGAWKDIVSRMVSCYGCNKCYRPVDCLARMSDFKVVDEGHKPGTAWWGPPCLRLSSSSSSPSSIMNH